MAEKSKILIIGGTGYIGKFVVEAGAKSGHPTFALVRKRTASLPYKARIIDGFKSSGVTLLHGDVNDKESLVNAIKQVDVVISTLGTGQISHQTKIIAAIKEAGNIKRFFPSEFGSDMTRVTAFEPVKTECEMKAQIRRTIEAEGIPYTYVYCNYFAGYFFPAFAQPGLSSPPRDKVIILGDGNPRVKTECEMKAQIRRTIEAEGIPYTYVYCNYFAGYFFPAFAQPGLSSPPRDKVIILGDGNPRAVLNDEHDIGTYTIKAVDDPRTLNKSLYIKPPKNIYSYNEIVLLWEKKIGKTLKRTYVLDDQIIKRIQGSMDFQLAIDHSVFVQGGQTNFEIDPSFGVEASELYPDVKYTTFEELVDQFV